MAGFDYFRRNERHYRPKTSRTALKALEARVLPTEAYIYSATSVQPVDEEPYDVNEIERVLGRDDLDIESNLLLVRILKHLLQDPEQEVALFAAEGMNLIEDRYAKRIEAVKRELADREDTEKARELARLYAELSRLYPTASTLRGFYLHEAYNWLTSLRKATSFGPDDAARLLRVLIDLGLYDQAASELEGYRTEEDKRFLLFEAEIEFQRRHYSRVVEVCRSLESLDSELDDTEWTLIEHWLEPDGA